MRAGNIRPVSPPVVVMGGMPEPAALDAEPGIPDDSNDAQFADVERPPTELIYAEDAWAPRGGSRDATVLCPSPPTPPPRPRMFV